MPIEKQNSLIWSFTKSQEPFIVDKIEVVKNTEIKFTSGEGNNTIYHSNPFATQQITDNILDDLRGFSYSTSKIEMLDDIRLDIWDVIKVTYLDGNEYFIPCMSIRQNMGASSTYIESFSKSKIQNQYKYEGPTAQFINRMATELLITNRVVASKVDADYVQSHAITTDNLEAIKADIKYAVIEDLDADFITTEELEAESAVIKVAVVQELSAEFGDIKQLKSDVAKIDTLIFGTASGDVIQTTFANSVIAQLGDAQIKSAMIQDVSASKITAGTIYTDDVTIRSQNGQMMLKDNTIQISDGTRARVQIGKDASNDYSINVWDKSGNLMFSQGGITDKAIKSAIIRNDMVSENANIHAGKLDINSLFTEINGSSNTIKATKIYLDETKQSLEVSFKNMTTTVSGLTQTQTSQGTQLSAIQGQITSKIWQQDIVTAVNNINIGARNLFLDTKTMDATKGNCSFTDTVVITLNNEGYAVAELPADGEWDGANFFFQLPIEEMENREVTLSFDAKSDELTSTNSQWIIAAGVYDEFGNRHKAAWVQNFQGNKFNTSDYVNGQWVRLRITFNLPPVSSMEVEEEIYETEYTKYGVGIYSSLTNIASSLQIKRVKCEYGNKATDWAPAPEDVDSEITTKYSVLEQTIEGFKTTVSETYTTKSDFDSLKIGSANRLIDSAKWDDFTCPLNNSTYATDRTLVTGGEVITIGYDVKGNVAKINGHTLVVLFFDSELTRVGYEWATANITTEYNRNSVTVTVPTEAVYVSIGLRSDEEVEKTYRKLKIESGNKATDWTPAPEDTETAITTLTTKYSALQQDVNGFKTTVSETYATKDNLNSVNTTLSTKYSALQQDVNSFKTTVSATYTTKETFDALQIGGTNRLLNSTQWDDFTCPLGDSSHATQRTLTTGGEIITIGYDVKGNVAKTNGHTILVMYYNAELTRVGYEWATADITTEYVRNHITVTIPSDAIYVSIGLRSDENVEKTYRKLKIESGNKATDWTPAPEDVDSEITTVQTIAQQTADKFNWLVKSGTSSSNFTLTDRMAELTASIISLNGNVKVNGEMIVDGAITAGKIAANAITADKVNIANLFAQEITVGGKFKATGSVWIPPTKEDLDILRKSINGELTLTSAQKTAFDFDTNNKINTVDFAICKNIVLKGADTTLANYPNYKKTNSNVQVLINPKDPNKILSITSTNSFGRNIDIFFGLDGMSIPKINTTLVDTYDILLQGKQLSELINGIEYSSGSIMATGDVIAGYGTTEQSSVLRLAKGIVKGGAGEDYLLRVTEMNLNFSSGVATADMTPYLTGTSFKSFVLAQLRQAQATVVTAARIEGKTLYVQATGLSGTPYAGWAWVNILFLMNI
jgi:hypothetical protein